jgi:hypothetical protein
MVAHLRVASVHRASSGVDGRKHGQATKGTR